MHIPPKNDYFVQKNAGDFHPPENAPRLFEILMRSGYTFFACFGLKNVAKMGKEISL